MLSITHIPVRGISLLFLFIPVLFLFGCASTPTYTYYELTSNPSGAQVYRGTTPDNLVLYKTTPFIVNSPTSLSWSYKYFQARKDGYKDSQVQKQPAFSLGTRTAIHFDLEPHGGETQLVPYQQRNTLTAYYEFLETYPDSPIKSDVFTAMLILIDDASDAEDQYERLANQYPESIQQFPDALKLAYTGPEGMRVKDVKELLAQGIGEAIIEQKILSAGKPYAEFSFDEIRALTEMGLTDKVIAAMLKVTNEQADKSQTQAKPVQNVAIQPGVQQGFVAPGSAVAQDDTVGDKVSECAAFLAKKEACDQLGGFAGMICMKAIPAGHNCF